MQRLIISLLPFLINFKKESDKMPDLYTRDEYGKYIPFDIEIYEQEIRNEAYSTLRKRNKVRNERKKRAKNRKIIGILMILIMFGACKLIVATGETDITYMLMILPIALMIIFSKDV